MTPKLLTRTEFREGVFSRDNHKCVFCGVTASETSENKLDAHHIIERRLWPDGGYYIENGATVCEFQSNLRDRIQPREILMKVFVVIKTEYSPNYNEGGAYEYRSVEFVTSNEETANQFCLENKPSNCWAASFEVEESEMR